MARRHLDRAVSLRVPMSSTEWESLGETKHHEWSEGVLYVNRPSRRHVLAAKALGRRLDDACPAGFTVYPDWGLRTPSGDFEPDLMVAPLDLPDDSYFAGAPLLVVEIASPTTRDLDWDRKLRAYGEAGAAWYWILDREGLTVFANRAGQLVQVQRIPAGEEAATTGPVALRLDPASLGGP